MKHNTRSILIPCAAAIFTIGAAFSSFAASGWHMEDESWVYLESDGSRATNTFKKSGSNWYWLDEDGNMAYSQIVEYNDDYYYVNSAGAMVHNEWRSIENEDAGDDEPDTWWYYLSSSGKAIKRSDNGSVKFTSLNTSTGSAKFTFDEEGHLLSGWLDEDGDMLTDDDAWKEGLYYCGDSSDGRMSTGWRYIEAVNEDDEDRDGDGYWFWFGTNGKKTSDTESKKINGRKYRFDEYGTALFEWYASPSSVASSSRYYNTEDQCWVSTGWFEAIPDEDFDPEGYDDGEEVWYYAESDGDLVTARFKRINGQTYAFDPYGKMLYGLYKIEFDDDRKTIISAEEIESEEDLPDEDDDTVSVYYFGDSPKEGAMKTGSVTVDLDGEKYSYCFEKSGSSKGAGTNGIDDDSIYIHGRRLEAESGTRYQVVAYKGEDYLINASGTLAKNKKNIKDADGVYYKTDSRGRVIDSGDEKLD